MYRALNRNQTMTLSDTVTLYATQCMLLLKSIKPLGFIGLGQNVRNLYSHKHNET